jgi:hypothetical protein
MEKVSEIHLNEDDISHGKDVLRHIYPVLGRGHHNRYLYDYQLTCKDGETQERRTRLDSRGREIAGDEISRGDIRPWSIKAIQVPGRLLSLEQRARFSYEVAEGERVNGRPAYLIEVRPKIRLDGGIIRAKVWVEKQGRRVLKAEVETATLLGYDEMTKECSQYHLRVHFKAVHLYGLERNGMLFPSHSELLVEYTGLVVPQRDTKAKVEIDYEKYRFFSTTTDYLFKGLKRNLCL